MVEKKNQERDSSIELLRCIAIIMIMAVHAGYYTFGTPTPESVRTAPVQNFFYIFYENVNIICVDVFLIISGWFGINAKFKSIGGFIFQILFFSLGGIILGALFTDFNFAAGLKTLVLGLFGEDFVSSYIIMYILTPVMNSYVKSASAKQMGTLLVIFYFVIFTSGLLFGNPGLQGKSVLPFCALYMLSRYIRLHSSLPQWKAKTDFFIWLTIIFGMTLAVWIAAYNGYTDKLGNIALNISTSYINPAVIAMSLFVLLFFSRFKFHNRFVNWCGISSFAAVIFHCWVFAPGESVEGYANFLRFVSDYNRTMFFVITPFLLIAVFLCAVVIDKLRIYLWSIIYDKIFAKHLLKFNLQNK